MTTIFIDDSPHVVSNYDDGIRINGHFFTWSNTVDLIEALEKLLNEHDSAADTAVSQPVGTTE